jgi:nucleotide-binding universal stress UspA family protein
VCAASAMRAGCRRNMRGSGAAARRIGSGMAAPDARVTLKRLLVPLDGSRLAECVLPASVSLAGHLHGEITLLHAMERGAPATAHGDRHLRLVSEAEAYLDGIAGLCRAEGVEVEPHVHPNEVGDVARSIVEHAEEMAADLVVLSTHGAGGARRVLFGSVAQQVLRRGVRPVLLIRPPDAFPAAGLPPFSLRRLLVPLDGTPASQAALPIASRIARAYDADVMLLRIVPTLATVSGERASTALLVPTATAASLDLEEKDARRSLEGLARALRAEGLRASAAVGRGNPAQGVLDGAAQAGAEMIAMATHGRTGLDAVFSGSVASRVVAKFTRPILLVRSPETEEPAAR